jgi:maleylpyruvate isomerase
MKLYGYWRSSSAWRVRIALGWKRIEYQNVPVNLLPGSDEQHTAAFRAKNPLGQVPILELDGPEPRRRLTQSLAILEYLEETHPLPPLLPADPWLRARARQLALLVVSGIQPLQNAAVLRRVRERLSGDDRSWAADFIAAGLGALEVEARETAGRFLVGDAPSFADVCLVPQLYNARRFGVDLAPFPTLVAVEAACGPLPAFAAAVPDRQPDAPTA